MTNRGSRQECGSPFRRAEPLDGNVTDGFHPVTRWGDPSLNRPKHRAALHRNRFGYAAVPAQTECHRVQQQLPQGLDDVVPYAHGDLGLAALGGLDEHPDHRIGAEALVEDSHPVVDQLEESTGWELLLLDSAARTADLVADLQA